MANRIRQMRNMLYDEIMKLKVPGNWEVLKTNIGMFTLTCLTKE